ncbi:MAG: ABC transporter ATP-binding protein [Pseudomonadales bacterium]
MSTPLLQVRSVGKKFKVYRKPIFRLAEFLTGGRRVLHQDRWVLDDISFSVGEGEAVAIVGRNGSGKSTLLSIIVGSRHASTGSVAVEGSVSALLELGMGFDPEFTGRQNAVMGLQLLGVQADDIPALVDWIERFSELSEYFDQPLRTYSSGMQVRLGFSVATAVRPDILIVDEAMAVGDAYFQHKSTARIRQLKQQGTTLLFVSHDASAVKALCDRAILLVDGKVEMDAEPVAVMDYYNALISEQQQQAEIQQEAGQTRSGSGVVRISGVDMLDSAGIVKDSFVVNDRITLRCSLEFSEEVPLPTVGFSIRDKFGNEVFGTNTYHLGGGRLERVSVGRAVQEFEFQLRLGVGSYSVTVAVHTNDTHLEQNYDWWDQACLFKVLPGNEPTFHGTSFLEIKSGFASTQGPVRLK